MCYIAAYEMEPNSTDEELWNVQSDSEMEDATTDTAPVQTMFQRFPILEHFRQIKNKYQNKASAEQLKKLLLHYEGKKDGAGYSHTSLNGTCYGGYEKYGASWTIPDSHLDEFHVAVALHKDFKAKEDDSDQPDKDGLFHTRRKGSNSDANQRAPTCFLAERIHKEAFYFSMEADIEIELPVEDDDLNQPAPVSGDVSERLVIAIYQMTTEAAKQIFVDRFDELGSVFSFAWTYKNFQWKRKSHKYKLGFHVHFPGVTVNEQIAITWCDKVAEWWAAFKESKKDEPGWEWMKYVCKCPFDINPYTSGQGIRPWGMKKKGGDWSYHEVLSTPGNPFLDEDDEPSYYYKFMCTAMRVPKDTKLTVTLKPDIPVINKDLFNQKWNSSTDSSGKTIVRNNNNSIDVTPFTPLLNKIIPDFGEVEKVVVEDNKFMKIFPKSGHTLKCDLHNKVHSKTQISYLIAYYHNRICNLSQQCFNPNGRVKQNSKQPLKNFLNQKEIKFIEGFFIPDPQFESSDTEETATATKKRKKTAKKSTTQKKKKNNIPLPRPITQVVSADKLLNSDDEDEYVPQDPIIVDETMENPFEVAENTVDPELIPSCMGASFVRFGLLKHPDPIVQKIASEICITPKYVDCTTNKGFAEIVKMAADADINETAFAFDGSKWYLWKNHKWEETQVVSFHTCEYLNYILGTYFHEKVTTWIYENGDQLDKAYRKVDEDQIIKEFEGLLDCTKQRMRNAKDVKAMEIFLRGAFSVEPDIWDRQDPNDPKLVVANGVVLMNRKTDELVVEKKEWYLRTRLDVEWKGLNHHAPLFTKVLNEMFQQMKEFTPDGRHWNTLNDEEKANLQKLPDQYNGSIQDRFVTVAENLMLCLGYAIARTPQWEHLVLFLHGPTGRNSKTFLLALLNCVLGSFLMPSLSNKLLHKNKNSDASAHTAALMPLQGAALAWINEPEKPKSGEFNHELFNLISGGGKIYARGVGQKQVEFELTHLLVLALNNMPELNEDEDSGALKERVKVFPCLNRFIDKPVEYNERKKDPQLKEKVKAEAPGILAMLVRYWQKYKASGIAWCPQVLEASSQYFVDNRSPFEEFASFITASPKQEDRKSATAVFNCFEGWMCREENKTLASIPKTKFWQKMKNKFGIPPYRVTGHNNIDYYQITITLPAALPADS